jgi:hypothetical protein
MERTMATTLKKQPTQGGPTTMTVEEWRAEGERRFGTMDSMHWKFKCPICGHSATPADWKEAGALEGAVAFSCVGRWIPGCKGTMDKPGKGPCNYSGGGLFKLNPVTVINEDGNEHHIFEFAQAG